MSKVIVVNKLNLGRETVGYRFDIMDGLRKLISFDIAESEAKYFLRMAGKERIKKGLIIQGHMKDNLFVTGDSDNVLEVTNGTQAKELLDKYFYSTDKEINSILNGINKSRQDLIKARIEKLNEDEYEFANCVEIRQEYIKLVKSLNGVRADLEIVEALDKSGGEFKFCIKLENVVDLFKCIYNITKLDGGSRINYKGYVGNYRDVINIPVTGTLDEFMQSVSEKVNFSVVDSMEGELYNNKRKGYFISFNDIFILESSFVIPGYDEIKNFDRGYLLKKYDLHEK